MYLIFRFFGSKISQKIKGYNRMNNSRGMKRQTIKIKNQWV